MKIKRTINGEEYEFELTNEEAQDTYYEKNTCSICVILKWCWNKPMRIGFWTCRRPRGMRWLS